AGDIEQGVEDAQRQVGCTGNNGKGGDTGAPDGQRTAVQGQEAQNAEDQEQGEGAVRQDGADDGGQQILAGAGGLDEHLQEHQKAQHQAYVGHAVVEGFLYQLSDFVPALQVACEDQSPQHGQADGGDLVDTQSDGQGHGQQHGQAAQQADILGAGVSTGRGGPSVGLLLAALAGENDHQDDAYEVDDKGHGGELIPVGTDLILLL